MPRLTRAHASHWQQLSKAVRHVLSECSDMDLFTLLAIIEQTECRQAIHELFRDGLLTKVNKYMGERGHGDARPITDTEDPGAMTVVSMYTDNEQTRVDYVYADDVEHAEAIAQEQAYEDNGVPDESEDEFGMREMYELRTLTVIRGHPLVKYTSEHYTE